MPPPNEHANHFIGFIQWIHRKSTAAFANQLRVICNRMVNNGCAFPLLVVCWPMCVEDNRTGVFTWFHFDWWPFIMCVVCVWRFGLGGKRRPYNEVVHSTANFGSPEQVQRAAFYLLHSNYYIESKSICKHQSEWTTNGASDAKEHAWDEEREKKNTEN